MTIGLFGATGKTGSRVLEQALEAGHHVKALVRSPDKLTTTSDKLEVIKGDMTDRADAEKTVSGVDAVIMAAGPVKGSPTDMLVNAANAIVGAMKSAGSKRLVWLTGAGVLDERDGKAFSRNLIRGIMKIAAGKVLKASENAYEIVRASGLDYTIVRPPMLADEPGGINLTGSYTPPKPIPVGRGDLAAFLLNTAVTGEWVKESPLVSYTEKK
ncbi:MAG: NAD(P)-dependent oxidoreductase [Spirochaetota bacterium]